VFRLLVPDNLKSGINKASFYDPEVNRGYAELYPSDHIRRQEQSPTNQHFKWTTPSGPVTTLRCGVPANALLQLSNRRA
jgi:hypothetical protein